MSEEGGAADGVETSLHPLIKAENLPAGLIPSKPPGLILIPGRQAGQSPAEKQQVQAAMAMAAFYSSFYAFCGRRTWPGRGCSTTRWPQQPRHNSWQLQQLYRICRAAPLAWPWDCPGWRGSSTRPSPAARPCPPCPPCRPWSPTEMISSETTSANLPSHL